MVAVVAGVLALPGIRLIGMAPDAIARSIYGSSNPFVESEAVARRVAELTRPQDFVYVAGSEPQILYHARRRSPTRFVISYPLMLETPLALPYQQECVRDLERNPPAAIVFARSPLSWLPRPNSPKVLMDYLGNTERRLELLEMSFLLTPPEDHAYLTRATAYWSGVTLPISATLGSLSSSQVPPGLVPANWRSAASSDCSHSTSETCGSASGGGSVPSRRFSIPRFHGQTSWQMSHPYT